MDEGVLLPLKMKVRLVIFSSLDQGFYNRVVTYLIIGINKKTKIEKFIILLIFNWIYIDHKKITWFWSYIQSKIKYITLFPSYNLKIENYMDKHLIY